MKKGHRHTGPITLLVSAGAIVLFALIGILLVWLSGGQADSQAGSLEEKWSGYDVILDENCRSGPLEGKASEKEVEYGWLHYRLNESPFFRDCDTAGTVYFQSDRGNQHFVRISYILDDGDEVYRSGMIPPDSHIREAKLQKRLADGIYPGICQIELFDMDSLERLGTLEEEITITVQN